MSEKRKMGTMGKLAQFSGIQKKPEPITEPSPVEEKPESQRQEKEAKPQKPPEKLVAVNVKVTKGQRDWLAVTAEQVRGNNEAPVPPAERVYPQHLIGVGIELLRQAGVDWSQVRNLEELREQLNLLED